MASLQCRLANLALATALIGHAGCAEQGRDAPVATMPRPVGAAIRGGSVALDGNAMVATACDRDNRAIHRVDLTTGRVATTEVGGAPAQLVRMRAPDGGERLAVTLRDRNEVALVDVDPAGEGHIVATAEVPPDPWGIAVTPQGELLVTSAWGSALTALDRDTLVRRWSVALAREPRAIAVAPDGRRAYVTHLVGDAITIVDLEPIETARPPTLRRLRALGGSYKNRIDRAIGAGTIRPTAALAYASVLSPSGSRLYVPHVIEENGSSTVRSIPGAYGGVPVEEETSSATVAVIATKGEHVLGARPVSPRDPGPIDRLASLAADASLGFAVAPLAAPSRQATGVALVDDSLLVASQGTDELVVLDARAIDPATSLVRTYAVGKGPSGVDADASVRIAVVWNQLSHDLSVVSLDSGFVETLPVAGDPLAPDVAAGRRLFMTERDRRISRDGRACAGCHPEGRDDGVVWKLGAGPRQTPTLVGRLDRGPFGWAGKHAELTDNMRETISRLGGTGLADADLAKLAAFLRADLSSPRRAPAAGEDAERGRKLFVSEEVGCSSCHSLEHDASDRRVHDVGSRAKADAAGGFRTPPLLLVGGTAPYFHDGRYATLEQLLEDNLDRMGQTTQLSRDDLHALAAFLRTL